MNRWTLTLLVKRRTSIVRILCNRNKHTMGGTRKKKDADESITVNKYIQQERATHTYTRMCESSASENVQGHVVYSQVHA